MKGELAKPMIGMIVAISPEGIIGVDGKIPWHYPLDMKRFKRLTLDSTLIMGRKTYESIGRPLERRRNIVITSRTMAGVECFPTIEAALATCTGNVWFIGGAKIYEEAMRWVDCIDVTYVPDRIDRSDAVRFPPINPEVFEPGPRATHPDDPRLEHQVFQRRGS